MQKINLCIRDVDSCCVHFCQLTYTSTWSRTWSVNATHQELVQHWIFRWTNSCFSGLGEIWWCVLYISNIGGTLLPHGLVVFMVRLEFQFMDRVLWLFWPRFTKIRDSSLLLDTVANNNPWNTVKCLQRSPQRAIFCQELSISCLCIVRTRFTYIILETSKNIPTNTWKAHLPSCFILFV